MGDLTPVVTILPTLSLAAMALSTVSSTVGPVDGDLRRLRSSGFGVKRPGLGDSLELEDWSDSLFVRSLWFEMVGTLNTED
jgi:hypothetical protein